MKQKKTHKGKEPEVDDLRPEYDLRKMSGGVRGKYVERFRAGTNLALLSPDVADVFPTDEAIPNQGEDIASTHRASRRSE